MEILTNDQNKCDAVVAGLYEVYDPEIGLNVVDLGLIYGINFNEERKAVEVVMTLTTQFCPMGESITNDVKQAVSNAFKDCNVDVTLSFEPGWSPDLMSPEGEAFLNG